MRQHLLLALAVSYSTANLPPTSLLSDEYRYEAPVLCSVHFVSQKVGWIGGYKGLFYTADRGKSWRQLPLHVGRISEYREGTADEQIGKILWANETTAVIRSRDGLLCGKVGMSRWQDIPIPSEILSQADDIAFVNQNEGWAVDWAGNIYSTVDGGKSWDVKARMIIDSPRRIVVRSSRELWIIAVEGMVGSTLDGGKTWQVRKLHPSALSILTSIQFVTDRERWATDIEGNVFHTKDGGRAWSCQNLSSERKLALEKIHFINEEEGWVIGAAGRKEVVGKDEGVILHTNDGGNNFEAQRKCIRDYPIDLYALNNGNAWIVCGRGTVLHTDNHGRNWTVVDLEHREETKRTK